MNAVLTERFRVIGRVQGVGYRHFVRVEARLLGLAGQVRNLADASVEVEAQGKESALAALAERLAEGPRFARVERVERQVVIDAETYVDFEIVR